LDGRVYKKGRNNWKEQRSLESSFSLDLVELKNCIGGVFWRVYMDFSNLIYVVVIFVKFKIF
jgi:hypothetical protein